MTCVIDPKHQIILSIPSTESYELVNSPSDFPTISIPSHSNSTASSLSPAGPVEGPSNESHEVISTPSNPPTTPIPMPITSVSVSVSMSHPAPGLASSEALPADKTPNEEREQGVPKAGKDVVIGIVTVQKEGLDKPTIVPVDETSKHPNDDSDVDEDDDEEEQVPEHPLEQQFRVNFAILRPSMMFKSRGFPGPGHDSGKPTSGSDAGKPVRGSDQGPLPMGSDHS